jgi:aminopeptidase YwaD
MIMKRFFIYAALFLLPGISAWAQSYDFNDKNIEQRLRRDIGVLASDSLQGREAGTEGEYMARTYISKQFEEIGLKPMFLGTSYFQKFTYNDIQYYGRNNRFTINGKKLRIYKDYYAIPFTGNDSVSGDAVFVGYGISAPAQGYDDYKELQNLEGKIFVIYTALPESQKNKPEVVKLSGKADKVKFAISKGAKAVVFIRPNATELEPEATLYTADSLSKIPVVFLRNADLLKKDMVNSIELSMNIIRETVRPAYNVAGYIDNGADSWVVIGAHYDHLGWAKTKSGTTEIHNGADDNASGTAAMMELARYFKTSAFKKNNYIFIGFSAEEKGLVGSTFFTNSKTIDPVKINYMIDIDMIGRLNDKRKVTVFGTGTCVQWNNAITKCNDFKFKLSPVKSGVGGSDHMSFYYKQVPDIFLHTGLHKDYHTPADDADKVNYNGETDVIKFTEKLVEYLDDKGKLEFTPTTSWSAFWGSTKYIK